MSQTSLRMRVVPRYPARITATNGISTTRDGVDLLVKSDYGSLIQVPSVTNPDRTFFLAWDQDIDNYQSVSFTNIINNIQDAIIGPSLAAIDEVNPGANQVVYFTGVGEAASYTASSFVRGISNASTDDNYRSLIDAVGNADINIPAGLVADHSLVVPGSDNAAALTYALSLTNSLWLPPGSYRFTGYALLTSLLNASIYGPGQLYYDNGTFIALVGSTIVAGHSDPGANFGTNISGGILLGSEGMQSAGSLLQSTGPSWPIFVPRRLGNPMQMAVYPNSYDGLGNVTAGGNVITLTYGYMRASDFDVGDQFFAGGVQLQIASITQSGGNVLTITAVNTGGSAYTFPTTGQIGVHHVYEYAEFTGNVSGAAVTRTSGDFINVSGPVFTTVRVNGTLYTQSGVAADTSHLTLTSSAGTQTGVQIRQKVLASYLAMFRWQGLRGSTETNVQASTTAYDTWELRASAAGLGFPIPLYFGTGDNGAGGGYTANNHVVMETNGTTRLGGANGRETVEVVGTANVSSNRLRVRPGATPYLANPEISSDGPGANIPIIVTPKGSGGLGVGLTAPNEKLNVGGAIRAQSNSLGFTQSVGAIMDWFSGNARWVAANIAGANAGHQWHVTKSGATSVVMSLDFNGWLTLPTLQTTYASDAAAAAAGCPIGGMYRNTSNQFVARVS
jgi:hypothetical protein